MSRVDVHTAIGPYPFRWLPHPEPDVLVRVLEREGCDRGWVAHLPGAWHRTPEAGNLALYSSLAPHRATLDPVPVIRPDLPGWEGDFARARAEGAVAVRAWPSHWRLPTSGAAMLELAAACAAHGLPLLLTVRLEDPRQRHALDVAVDLSAADIRALARARTGARLVVLSAGRATIEEVHWGLTPEERARVFWDFSWVWGPPEDDLAHLVRTVGADRFVYGSGWPLRLAQGPRANLALLPDDVRHASMADPRTWLVTP